MNLQRFLFQLLVHLFPRSTRNRTGHEMLEVIEDRVDAAGETSLHDVGREAFGFVAGACTAWRSHLGTAAGVRTGASLGSALWFGLLVGLGPGRRTISHWLEPGALLGANGVDFHIAASVLAAIALILVRSARTQWAVALLITGVALAAVSNSQPWSNTSDLVLYEFRWLALPAIAVLWLRIGASRSQTLPVVVGASVGALGGFGSPFAGRNYDMALNELLAFAPSAAIVTVVLLAIAAPLLSPGTAAMMIPGAAHLGIAGTAQALRGSGFGDMTDPTLVLLALWLSFASALRLRFARRRIGPSA